MSFPHSLKPFVLPVAAVVLAQVVGSMAGQHSLSLAPPSEIITAGADAVRDGSLLRASVQTVYCVLGGFAIGSVMGIFIGVVLALARSLDYLTNLTFEIFRAMPPVAVIPVWLIIYGLGYRMEVAIIAFSIVWPSILMTKAAVRSVTPQLLEVSKVLGLSYRQRVFKIVLPAALPRIFVALRVTMGFSLILAVTIEIVANPQGMGSAIMLARDAINPGLMLAYLICIGALGVCLNAVMNALQKQLFGNLDLAG